MNFRSYFLGKHDSLSKLCSDKESPLGLKLLHLVLRTKELLRSEASLPKIKRLLHEDNRLLRNFSGNRNPVDASGDNNSGEVAVTTGASTALSTIKYDLRALLEAKLGQPESGSGRQNRVSPRANLSPTLSLTFSLNPPRKYDLRLPAVTNRRFVTADEASLGVSQVYFAN